MMIGSGRLLSRLIIAGQRRGQEQLYMISANDGSASSGHSPVSQEYRHPPRRDMDTLLWVPKTWMIIRYEEADYSP